jgi:ferredoxin
MAFLKDKLPDNTPGKFYVDRQCIDCDVCRDTAPAHFTRNDENGYSYVYKQPVTPGEIALCEEALSACPVEAIGDDAKEPNPTRTSSLVA